MNEHEGPSTWTVEEIKTRGYMKHIERLEGERVKWEHRAELRWTVVFIMFLLLLGCINAGKECLEVQW